MTVLVLIWITVLGWSTPARTVSDDCGFGGLWVAVIMQSDVFESFETMRMIELLRAYLERQRIEVCVASKQTSTQPIATIVIDRESPDRLSIAIEIRDEVTDKRIVRELDLTQTSRDSWPVVLAVAADELLRASWAELALPEKRNQRVAPLEVRRLVSEQTQPRRWFTFGAAFAYDYYRGGQHHLGADLRLAVWPVDRVDVDARVGFRRGMPVTAPHGTIETNAVVGGVGLALRAVRNEALVGADLRTRADLVYLFFQGRARGDARASAGSGLAVVWSAGADLWVRAGERIRILAGLALGVVVRPVHATDTDEVVTSVSGLSVATSLGIVGAL